MLKTIDDDDDDGDNEVHIKLYLLDNNRYIDYKAKVELAIHRNR